MAWDDGKDAGDLIRSSEWDTMVSDQKGHGSRHTESGIDSLYVENLASQGASGTVPVSQGDGTLAMEMIGDADTVDGSNVFVQDTEPTAENTGDIWIATGGNL